MNLAQASINLDLLAKCQFGTIVDHYMTSELEGQLLFMFGDIKLGATILSEMEAKQAVESENYHWCKQAEKGRIAETDLDSYCSNVPECPNLQTHGVRFFETVKLWRAHYGIQYTGYGVDYLEGCKASYEKETGCQEDYCLIMEVDELETAK